MIDHENIPAVEFASLIGEHVLDAVDTSTEKVKAWYGDSFEDASCIRFRLDGKVYTAIENPDDGYRSSMEKLFVSTDEMKNVFPPCKVLVRHNEKDTDSSCPQSNDTLEFIDVVTGKIVMRVGTDNVDDYYPYFVAEWNPGHMAVNASSGDEQR
jgi:hypothetical protein